MSSEYYSNLSIHAKYEPYKWIFAANILLIIGLFKSIRACVIIHGIGFLILCLSTVYLGILLGLKQVDPQDPPQYLHALIGTSVIIMMFIQVLLGIFLRISNMVQFTSHQIKSTSLVHTILGISIWIICKIQIYYTQSYLKKLSTLQAVLTVLFEVLSIGLYLWLTIKNRIQQSPKYLQNKGQNLRRITSINELSNRNDVAIIKNKVYDLTPMKQWHPPGFQLIQQTNSRQFDKYLLGIYSSEIFDIDRHTHSKQSLSLLDNPIAQIGIRSNIQNLPEIIEVNIIKMQRLSEKPIIYEMHLRSTQAAFVFKPYQNLNELGRYYSLTINSSITRLYTTVNFLQNQNIQIMKKCFKKTNKKLDKYFETRQNNENSVPILFKQYSDGVFTSILVHEKISKIQLSHQLGLGFSFNDASKGDIIIVAGGTGIYPFSDLIDLLYKNKKLKQNANYSQQILNSNPILKNRPFLGFNFKLFLSFPDILEIHPITYHQLNQLSDDPSIQITLRVNHPSFHKQENKIKLARDYFDQDIKNLISKGGFSKIMVCGPLTMRKNLAKIVKESNLSQNQYAFM